MKMAEGTLISSMWSMMISSVLLKATTAEQSAETPGGLGDGLVPTCAALIAAAAVAAYGRTFSAPLLFDDDSSIAGNPTIRHLGTALFPPNTGATVTGRPILNLSFALNYAVSGTSVWSYHAFNLAIHVLAGLALFGIVRRSLGLTHGPKAALAALSAALLWVLHPLQTESVTYIVQRAESLMGLFYLLTLYCFIRGARADGAGGRPWYALCIAACFLGMGTKEVMVSAPLVVLLYDRALLAGSFREGWGRRRLVYCGLASSWVWLGLLVISAGGNRGGTGTGLGTGVRPWDYALTQFPAVWRYLGLCFWPRSQIFDYATFWVDRPLSVLPQALGALFLAGLTVWTLVCQPVLGLLGFSFFAILAPTSLVPGAYQMIAEHRMYLALVPVVVLGVLGIYRSLGRAALPACLGLAAALGIATFHRNGVYSSEESLWSDTVAKSPQNYRAHNNLGCALSKRPGRMGEAIAEYGEALRLKPDMAEAHYNLGFALEATPGRLDDAVLQYVEALRLRPDYVQAHYNLGTALDALPGRSDEAADQFEDVLRLKPDYAEAHYNLGCALSKIDGRLDEAISQYEEALRLKPDLAEGHYNLGCALDATAGRVGDAVAHYQEAVRLRPDYIEARSNLGTDLLSLGRTPDAIAQYEEALRLRPDNAALHLNLAYALLKTPGRGNDALAHLREAARLDPGNDLPRQILVRLGALNQ